MLYSLKAHPNYPSAHDIKKSLRKARLTETELSVEHVEMLLNVLVLDGEIEKVGYKALLKGNSPSTANADTELCARSLAARCY